MTLWQADVAAGVSQGGMRAFGRLGPQAPPLVSALVSTYNSARFIDGCLADLEAQTIADQMEIIVVDSASEEGEGAIVNRWQERYPNILYTRTERREPVYAAWNRAIRMARGTYLTNANTDDRHKANAFERMSRVLDMRPDVALVYADVVEPRPGSCAGTTGVAIRC
jgi:glycosyltransferase involved in cell wall biosynthesis